MLKNLEPLRIFAKAKGPECLYQLPSSFPRIPKHAEGTNTEFLLRVTLEALDVLHRGDSQLSRFRFGKDDVNGLYRGFLFFLKLAKDEHTTSQEMSEAEAIPQRLQAINTYYEDKMRALAKAKNNAEIVLPELRREFQTMLVTRDYKGLILQYPNFACLLDMDDDLGTSPEGAVHFTEYKRSRKLLELFKDEVDSATNLDMDVISWLGKPECQKLLEQEISLCNDNTQRNAHILEATRQFAARLAPLFRPETDSLLAMVNLRPI